MNLYREPDDAPAMPRPEPATASLDLVVHRMERVAGDAMLVELTARNRARLPACKPGAHITLRLAPGIERAYSLVRPHEAPPDRYVVCVKHEGRSTGGSRYVHTVLQPGAHVEAMPPANFFPLHEDAPHSVLIAGGIGITPILCMAARLRTLGRSWELHYFAPRRDDAALLNEVLALGSGAHFHATREGSDRPGIASLVAAAAGGSHLYCCGPRRMLEAFRGATRSLPAQCVHLESFTAVDAHAPSAQAGTFRVVLAKSQREVTVTPGVTILEALRGAGLDAPSSCRQGVCGVCETRVISGEPDHRDMLLSDAEKASNKTMMICCSRAKGGTLVLDL